MEIYSIDTNGEPVYEPPESYRKPYSKYTEHYAANIEGASTIVDNVLKDIGKLTNKLAELESKISSLGECWNNCIEIDNKIIEYVPLEDLNKTIEETDDAATSGKEKCDDVLNDFNETINNINTYLKVLRDNYLEYKTTNDKLSECKIKIIKLDKNNPERPNLISQINSLTKDLEDYYEIPDITEYGRWVE